MTLSNILGRTGKAVAAATVLGVVGAAAIPQPAHAVSPGAAVGIGLGAFALGSALGSAGNPYYGGGYPAYGAYPYGYYPPAPAYYYPPAPAYYRSCWSPYWGRYVAC